MKKTFQPHQSSEKYPIPLLDSCFFSFGDVLLCNFLQEVSKLPCKMEPKQFFLKVSVYYLYFPRLGQINFPGLKLCLILKDKVSFKHVFGYVHIRKEQNGICQTLFLQLGDIGQKQGRKQKEILKNTWESNWRSYIQRLYRSLVR